MSSDEYTVYSSGEAYPERDENLFNVEDMPPLYPNGWIPVLESRELKSNEIKPIIAVGTDLVVYRGLSGKSHVIDPYCPHLGANLGMGGKVIEDSVKCPFHGWTFDANGLCSHVPGIECSSLPKAKLKYWESLETNGYIFVWYHSRNEMANYYPFAMEDIASGKYVYRDRFAMHVKCHFQDITENLADRDHLTFIHSIMPEYMCKSKFILNFHRFVEKVVKVEYVYGNYKFTEQKFPEIPVSTHLYLFGRSVYATTVLITLYSPVHFSIQFKFGLYGAILLASVQPIRPKRTNSIGNIYTDSTIPGYILAKILKYFMVHQALKDKPIWDNKKTLKKPYLYARDHCIKSYRDWLKLFH